MIFWWTVFDFRLYVNAFLVRAADISWFLVRFWAR